MTEIKTSPAPLKNAGSKPQRPALARAHGVEMAPSRTRQTADKIGQPEPPRSARGDSGFPHDIAAAERKDARRKGGKR